MNLDKLVKNVEQWSINKGLDQADSSKQYLKVSEEVGEVAAALARNNMDALKDGIGDVIVTLVILAQQNNTTIEECLSLAYQEIAGRKGKMINGVFVKQEDIKEGNEMTKNYVEIDGKEIRVFQICEGDAVAAENLEDAIEWYKDLTGFSDDELYAPENIETFDPEKYVRKSEAEEGRVTVKEIVKERWAGKPFIAVTTAGY